MSTPSRRMSGTPLPDNGPSRSVLQQLLEEINGPNTPTAPRKNPTPQGTPRPSHPTTTGPNCPWVAGGSIALDARAKLRAADEARQRKLSMTSSDGVLDDQAPPPLRRHSTQTGVQPMASGTGIWKPPQLLTTFKGVEFADPPTLVTARTTSSASGTRGNISPKKLSRSSPDSPEPSSSIKRTKTLPISGSDGQGDTSSATEPTMTMRGGGIHSPPTTLFRCATFTERSDSSTFHTPVHPTCRSTHASLSSFRPVVEGPKSETIPTTPLRNNTMTDYTDSPTSPAWTPAWMKPFHLVDSERSIYKNVHGEDWKDSPLCLYCFRQHGEFHRVYHDGCEVCGRQDVLESHYWEASNGSC